MDGIAFAAHMESNKTSSCNFAIFVILLRQPKQFVSQTYFQKMTESNTPGFNFETQWQLVSLQARKREMAAKCESLVTDFFHDALFPNRLLKRCFHHCF